MKKLNFYQNQLGKIRSFFQKNGRMPSYSEIAVILRYKSKNAAHYIVKKWLTEGALGKDSGGKLLPGKYMKPLKVLGTITAGFPSPAEEENADTMSLDDWLIENKEASFMLKVDGDSMIDAGIHPGDMVIVQRGKRPKNGDVVIAEVDKEWTMKYYRNNSGIRLEAANKKYPVIVPKEELRVLGVVTSVIRKYS